MVNNREANRELNVTVETQKNMSWCEADQDTYGGVAQLVGADMVSRPI